MTTSEVAKIRKVALVRLRWRLYALTRMQRATMLEMMPSVMNNVASTPLVAGCAEVPFLGCDDSSTTTLPPISAALSAGKVAEQVRGWKQTSLIREGHTGHGEGRLQENEQPVNHWENPMSKSYLNKEEAIFNMQLS